MVARFVAGWTTTPVAYENVSFDPPSKSPWVRFTLTPLQGETAGSSPNGTSTLVRDSGLVSIQLFIPAGDGSKAAMGYVDDLIAIFEHSRFNGIMVYSASVTVIGADSQGWHQTNITIPYRSTRNV
jgi:hypothetical protein